MELYGKKAGERDKENLLNLRHLDLPLHYIRLITPDPN